MGEPAVKSGLRLLGMVIATGILAACSTAPKALPQIAAWRAAAGPAFPAKARCPNVARVDLGKIASRQAALGDAIKADAVRIGGLFDAIAIPPSAPHRPSQAAAIVLRAVEPPGGMYANTVWSVVWQEPDGRWWYWRQNRDPAKPAPPGSPAGQNEDEVRWPPTTGRLSERQARALDLALASPCRAWEPDVWPLYPPLKGRGPEEQRPPPDWTPIYVELTEPGRRPRRIAGPLRHHSHVGVLAGIAISPAGEP